LLYPHDIVGNSCLILTQPKKISAWHSP